MSHIFISYSKKNPHYAQKLAEDLRNRGFDVWIDDVIEPSDNWWDAIVDAIETCSAFAVIMTPESKLSKWVQREVALAEKHDKPVFPLLMEGENWPLFVLTQFEDITNQQLPPERFYNRLVEYMPRKATRGIALTNNELRSPLPEVNSAIPAPFEWCKVWPGYVTLKDASEYGGSKGGKVRLDRFYISKYPITNSQYEAFTYASDGYREATWWDFSSEALAWREKHPRPTVTGFPGPHLPRTHVSWYEAMAFCRWLTARTGTVPNPNENNRKNEPQQFQWQITLPTEQQWQRAAQGDDYRLYPWGRDFYPDACNTDEGGVGKPTPVTQYRDGVSPCGVMDMGGNVWEWCLTPWGTDYLDITGDKARVVRGGSWLDTGEVTLVDASDGFNPADSLNFLGFRVVAIPGV